MIIIKTTLILLFNKYIEFKNLFKEKSPNEALFKY